MSLFSLKNNRQLISGNELLQTAPPQRIARAEPVQTEGSPKAEKRETIKHNLPSGHEVQIDLDGHEIAVEDTEGNIAVRIRLDSQTPVVELDGAQIRLRSTDKVNVECKEFAVNAEENVHLNAGGHLTIESTEELHINCEMDVRIRAKVIWLN